MVHLNASVNASEVTAIGRGGFVWNTICQKSSLGLSSAAITLCSWDEDVAVYHLYNGTRERLPSEEMCALNIPPEETRQVLLDIAYAYPFA